MAYLNRRQFGLGLVATSLAGTAPWALAQQPFPSRPVTIVIGYPAGGPTDVYGRAMGKLLSDYWKQPVIIENRPGASGSIAAMHVLNAAADGYTLLFTNNATNGAYEVLNPKTASYRTLRDFQPVALYGIAPSVVMVRTDLPVKNMQEFIALCKASPGKITYASPAVGSSPHLASEMISAATGIKMLHVPYSGTAPLMQALLGGQVDMYIGGVASSLPHVKSGKLRYIGAVSATRLKGVPDLPTLAEQGISGVVSASWYGLLASVKVPETIAEQINADTRKVMDTPAVQAQLDGYGVEYTPATRAQVLQVVKAEIDSTAKLVAEGRVAPVE